MQIHIRFARHGNTSPALVDRERTLTDIGRRQAAVLGADWNASGFHPTLVMSSMAPRAVETAQIATCCKLDAIIQREELYFGTNPDRMTVVDRVYESLGNTSLSVYDKSIAGGAIKAYAAAASDVICEAIRERGITSLTQVAVFGHAVLLAAVARHMFQEYGTGSETVSSVIMEECGVIQGNLVLPDSDHS